MGKGMFLNSQRVVEKGIFMLISPFFKKLTVSKLAEVLIGKMTSIPMTGQKNSFQNSFHSWFSFFRENIFPARCY